MQISVKDISKTFGAFAALDSVSADFHAGKLYVVAGPNGAGKTTLLKIIAGLETKTSGEVTSSAGVVLGVMMQESFLYGDLSPRENLTLYARLMGTGRLSVDEAAKTFDLESFFDHDVATLSHGQRQRTALARAVLKNPNAILLDEPFLGLDTAAVAHTLKFMEAMKARGGIVVVATHEMDVVKGVADDLLVLEKGRVKYFDKFNV